MLRLYNRHVIVCQHIIIIIIIHGLQHADLRLELLGARLFFFRDGLVQPFRVRGASKNPTFSASYHDSHKHNFAIGHEVPRPRPGSIHARPSIVIMFVIVLSVFLSL